MKYIHIGNGVSLDQEKIIGIFDMDSATVSRHTQKFIRQKEKEGKVDYTDTDLPRSFLLVKEEKDFTVKLSRISTLGLRQRAKGEEKNLS